MGYKSSHAEFKISEGAKKAPCYVPLGCRHAPAHARRGGRLSRCVARDAGLSRESLYRALSATGNPSLATILKVARALGVRLHADVR